MRPYYRFAYTLVGLHLLLHRKDEAYRVQAKALERQR